MLSAVLRANKFKPHPKERCPLECTVFQARVTTHKALLVHAPCESNNARGADDACTACSDMSANVGPDVVSAE